jgi:hypothetical protein
MADTSLPDPARSAKTPWLYRELPLDPVERALFLLERIDRTLRRYVDADLGRLHAALPDADPSPGVRRQLVKELAALGLAGEALQLFAREFRRALLRPDPVARREARAWFERQARDAAGDA